MVVPEQAVRHDSHVAVRLDGHSGAYTEGDLDATGLRGIELEPLHASHPRPARVAHRGPRLETAGKREVGSVGVPGAPQESAENQYRGEENGTGDQDEESNEGQLALRFHHSARGPITQRPGRRSFVSICR